MKTSIKTLLIISAVAGSAMLTTSYAQSPLSPSGSQDEQQSQSKILADIDGILHATAQTATNMAHQLDQFLSSIEGSNTAISRLENSTVLNSTTVATSSDNPLTGSGGSNSTNNQLQMDPTSLNNYINFQANQETYKNVANSLSTGQAIINPAGFVSHNSYLSALFQSGLPQPGVTDSTAPPSESEVTTQLTTNTPASDSLYLTDPKTYTPTNSSDKDKYLSTDEKSFITKPTINLDSYMAAPTFFSPYNGSYFVGPGGNKAYSSEAAQSYLAYLTDAYDSIGSDIDWDKLAPNKVVDAKDAASVRAKDIYTLKAQPVYQKFQLTKRSILAQQSAVQQMLNYLYYERKPSVQLAQQAHLPPEYTTTNYSSDGKSKVVTVSPLQYENYVANHRVNSSKWYQAMSTASPATVQREILYVLADILSKMQQQHMDNERMLFMQALQTNETTNAMRSTASQQVNDINNFIKNNKQMFGIVQDKKSEEKSAFQTAGVPNPDEQTSSSSSSSN